MMRVLATVLVAFGLTASAVMASVEDQIRERIAPVGDVCLEGESCGSAAPAAASGSSDGPRSGEEVYSASCQACHASGVAGAPVMGNAEAWAPRVEKGFDTLLEHAINGFNAMPPKGGCASCSDEEVQAAVEHMVQAVE